MYQSFFGLKDNPFDVPPDSRCLELSSRQRESMDKLARGLEEKADLLVLIGGPGTGKTTLLHALLESMTGKTKTAYVGFVRFEFQDFLQYLLEDFGVQTTVSTTAEYLMQLHRWLIEQHDKNGPAVLCIDEAQSLPLELLEGLNTLLDFEFAGDQLLQIVLAGQPSLREILQSPQLRRLRQRIRLTCELLPLSFSDTRAYIRYRMTVAGGSAQAVFRPRAYKAIQYYTGGILRLVHRVCDDALLIGYAEGKRRITPRIVREAAQELDLRPDQRFGGPSHRRIVAALVVLLLLGVAFYVVQSTSTASLAWSQIQTVAQRGYRLFRTRTENLVPRLVEFVDGLGGEQTSSPPVAEQQATERTDTVMPEQRTSDLATVNTPKKRLERDEIQATIHR